MPTISHFIVLTIIIITTLACPTYLDYDPKIAFDAFERQCMCASDLPYSTG
jgi:hypothetical protein